MAWPNFFSECPKIWLVYLEFYWKQKFVTDICSQSFRKNVISPKLNNYRISFFFFFLTHLFGQKNLKQNYSNNIHYFWWVNRGGMGLQILIYTLFDANLLVSIYSLSK